MLFNEIVDARTNGRTDGRRTPDIEVSQKLTEHFVLRWAKKNICYKCFKNKILKIAKCETWTSIIFLMSKQLAALPIRLTNSTSICRIN